jgi:hypothetical protein
MNTQKTTYRLAISATLAAVFMLVWFSLGVGIIGADGDPANVMYFVVVAVGVIGALIARLQPQGMSRMLIVMAVIQALIAAIAIVAKMGYPFSGPLELLLLNGFFVALFLGLAWLFHRAAV